jgi:hypothetical protein
MTHDRVLRLVPLFDSREAAARYAIEQGVAWIDAPPTALARTSTLPNPNQ